MVGRKSMVELPEGWIESINTNNGRKVKIYTNEETSKKFYSKTEVMRYVNRSSVTQESPQQPTQHSTPQQPTQHSTLQQPVQWSSPQHQTPQQLVQSSTPQQPSQQHRLSTEDEANNKIVSSNEILDWLPSGWRMEMKSCKSGAHKGRDYKSYVDPSTGRKFYSKPEVLQHLKSVEHGEMTSNRRKRKHVPKNSSSVNPYEPVDGSPSKQKPDDSISKELKTADATPAELTERTDASLDKANPTPGWLPSGWKIEFKTRKTGNKYKYFIDPTTGFKFYSKPEVLTFLNDGKRVALSRKKNNVSHRKPTKKRDVKQVATNKFSEDLKAPPTQVTTNSKSLASKQKQKTFDKDLGTNVIIERGTPDKLPSGWIKEIKIQKQGNYIRKDPYYTDPVSGYVFRSQTDALRYLETGDIYMCAIRPKKRDELDWLSGDINRHVNQVAVDKSAEELKSPPCLETTNSKRLAQKPEIFVKNLERNIVVERGTPDKLPSGWIKEIRIQKKGNNIRKDPYYTDPVSGYVFRSQTDALRYLETGDINMCAIRPKKRDEFDQVAEDKSAEELKSPPSRETTNSKRLAQKPETFVKNLGKNIVVERGTPDKLPSGWIKEIKIQTIGSNIRKDPYYTDPVSGYVFRSQTDALRYLETGDINICAIRPKKRDELDWLSGDINSSSAADVQKLQVQDNKGKHFEDKQTSISGSLKTKSKDVSTKRQLQLRSSGKTSEGNLEEESHKKDPHPKSMASARKKSKTVNDENGEQKLPVVDGKRLRGRKKAYTGTMKRKTNLPCRSSKRLLDLKMGTIEEGKGEPVQTEPETNTVKPSLAETLNEALGIEEDVREDAAVENNPDPNPPRKETINKRVEENNQQQHHQQHQQQADLYHQLGGPSSSSPWTEIIKEPETTTWLMNPPSLDFSFKTHSSNANQQGPIVQDYFQQEAAAANKKADLGAPGFTSFNFFQGNVAAPGPGPGPGPAPPSAGSYNFLQTSSQSPPANPLFYSGIMPAHQSSPQNLMFPPDNTQNQQSPAHPMFPHGGFGFGFGFQ